MNCKLRPAFIYGREEKNNSVQIYPCVVIPVFGNESALNLNRARKSTYFAGALGGSENFIFC